MQGNHNLCVLGGRIGFGSTRTDLFSTLGDLQRFCSRVVCHDFAEKMSNELLHRKVRRPSTSSSSVNEPSKLPRSKPSPPPDQPLHAAQDSLFSTSSGWTNYKGFFNLSMLLLVVSNARVALENLMKYGILISPSSWIGFLSTDFWMWPNLAMVLCSNITCVLVLFTEKALARKWIGNQLAVIWYICLISVHVITPVLITLYLRRNPLFAFHALSIIVIETLKLVSYIHVNYWCRCAREKDEKSKDFAYPANLTLKNLYYFLFAPTLCYELNFPRTPARRKRFIIKRIVELIVFSFVYICLVQQWIFPLVRNSVSTLADMPYGRRIERLLKLAVPNILIWLLMFYTVFHSFMNLLAEILRFADREFYRDFWNAETITYFWQTWNIPVHRWCARHVYKPMVKNKFSRLQALTAVFVISAIFHEYLVSVPLHMFRLWAFGGMLMQIPLGIFTDKILKGGRAGNIVVWLSLILGQPMAILMYVHDWYLINHPEYISANATEPILGPLLG
uniref:Diacylglycerol O-acyltransferase n=2 Tax=Panagrolaimus sp. JU765 TaxID=591449 RepID=A0AC34RSU5_9BILA